ncbi:hypothetical protein H0H87_006730 [Tephrocybe sp. NHM501043]|nr:hypothetical protein H0H87_006730 [Tephrocybe sp. NHM501043]
MSFAEPTRIPYPCVTISPTKPHTATVIWLHGLGNTGEEMSLPATSILGTISGLEHVKFIFPTAHVMNVTAFGIPGAPMNSWVDAYSFKYATRKEDEKGFITAASLIDHIVMQEEMGHAIPLKRILIGGISQGSSLALFTALTGTRPFAGVFVLAGYIPLRHKIKELMAPHAPTLPIFWGHGREDPRLKINFSLTTAKRLSSDLGVPFDTYRARLGSSDPEPLPEQDPLAEFEEFDVLSQEGIELSDSDSSESVELRAPVYPYLAEVLESETLRHPGVRFIAYEDLGHWVNEAMLQDLGVWMRALVP